MVIFNFETGLYGHPVNTDTFFAPLSRVGKCAKFAVFYAKIVQTTPQRLWRESLRLQKFSETNTVLSLPFSQQIQFMLIVNIVNLNWIIKIKELYCMTKQEVGKLRSKFTWWPPSWIWAFQVSRPPQLLRVSITIVYTCQDHVLESLKMAFFRCDTWPQIFQNDYKICEAEDTVTPLINKICKPCLSVCINRVWL